VAGGKMEGNGWLKMEVWVKRLNVPPTLYIWFIWVYIFIFLLKTKISNV
jgi:hypothetical protein